MSCAVSVSISLDALTADGAPGRVRLGPGQAGDQVPAAGLAYAHPRAGCRTADLRMGRDPDIFGVLVPHGVLRIRQPVCKLCVPSVRPGSRKQARLGSRYSCRSHNNSCTERSGAMSVRRRGRQRTVPALFPDRIRWFQWCAYLFRGPLLTGTEMGIGEADPLRRSSHPGQSAFS